MKRLACLLTCLLLTAACCLSAIAREYPAPRVVKAGYFYKPDLNEIDEKGERSGYGYEYLCRLATCANWTYEYVGYDKTWSDMLLMLENGDIDLLTVVQKTPDRQDSFDYGDLPMGYSSTIVTIREGNQSYIAERPQDWGGARVGLLKASARNTSFDAFMREHGVADYTPVFFDKYDDLLLELREGGAIDLAVTDSMRPLSGEWILASFDQRPIYVAVRKGDTELLNQLNAAQHKLEADSPQLLTELSDKHYAVVRSDAVPFTAEERAFIEDMRAVSFTAIINPDRKPFSWFEYDEATGILTDVVRLAIRRSGLNIEIIETKSHAEYKRLVESGKADIILDEWYGNAHAENLGYKLTGPYITASAGRLYLKEHGNEIETMAIVSGSGMLEQYGEELRERYKLIEYVTIDAAQSAVLKGECDAACLYYHTAERLVYNDDLNRIAIDKLYSYATDFAIAVSARHNVLLLTVLEKAVSGISEAQKDNIVAKYVYYPEKPFSLTRFIFANPIVSIAIVAAALLATCLICFLISAIRRREREHSKMLEEHARNELLNDALAAAEAAGKAKSQFLTHVSHELRTPLNSIIGYIELARETPDNIQKIRSYLDGSEASAKQLLMLINNVLDVSAIDTGRLKLARETFDLKGLLRELTKTYTAECQRKGLRFELVMENKVDDWLVGDQLRLNQILINLLGNAIKFTDKGYVRLAVRQTDGAGGMVSLHFEVSDTGCGMSEETIKRIWMPFEQDSASTARKYGGSGLGLSIVRSLVTVMDGVADVRSVVGEGSTFTVELPFSICRESHGDRLSKFDAIRVLVADDTREDCEYLSLVLDRMGVRHACVYSGKEALNALEQAEGEQDPFNVCLLDWSMPDMNGLETARSIRARFGAGIAIVIMSAHEMYQADRQAKNAGANFFVTKPLFQSALFDLLMTLAGGRLITPPTGATADVFKGRRVLLAEDNRQNREVTKELLQKSGLMCDTAENGKQAVDSFVSSREGYYDAVLMDIRMPVIDGLEAARLIRASDHRDAKTIPIIAITANAFAEDVSKSLQSGMNAHISKPIDMDALLNALNRLMAKR